MYLELPGLRVRVPFLWAAGLAFCLYAGGVRAVGTVFLCAALHECGHLAFLLSYGCKDLSLELRPGGAAITGGGAQALPYPKLLAAALAGPVVNLLLAAALAAAGRALGTQAFLYAVRVNLLLGCCNLLPLSFLDGGRALACVRAMVRDSPAPAGRADAAVLLAMFSFCAAAAALGLPVAPPALFTAYCFACACGKKSA